MATWWDHFNFEHAVYGRGYNIQTPVVPGAVNILPLIDWLGRRSRTAAGTSEPPRPSKTTRKRRDRSQARFRVDRRTAACHRHVHALALVVHRPFHLEPVAEAGGVEATLASAIIFFSVGDHVLLVTLPTCLSPVVHGHRYARRGGRNLRRQARLVVEPLQPVPVHLEPDELPRGAVFAVAGAARPGR